MVLLAGPFTCRSAEFSIVPGLFKRKLIEYGHEPIKELVKTEAIQSIDQRKVTKVEMLTDFPFEQDTDPSRWPCLIFELPPFFMRLNRVGYLRRLVESERFFLHC